MNTKLKQEVIVCSLKHTIPVFRLDVNNKAVNSLKKSDRFLVGCKAVAGLPVTEIANELQISREWVYQQKDSVLDHISSLDNDKEPVPSIIMDAHFVKRMVLSLSLDCHASADGIIRTFDSVLGLHISAGKISSILAEAAGRAAAFDDSIPLESITQGANDEIFQGDTPVLTGIDAESTYVYLLAQAGDRSADTWQLFMEDRREHGLELQVSISDGGTGLAAGIPKAFPDVCVQPDIFHELRPVGAEVARLERKAEKLISDEARLEGRAQGKHPHRKTLEQLDQIHRKVEQALREYDLLNILFHWLVELVGFSGYQYQEACLLAEWVLSEMEALFPGHTKLIAQTGKLRKKLPQILSFLQRLEDGFAMSAVEKGIPPEAFHIMYTQKAFHPSSREYIRMEYCLGTLLGDGCMAAKQEFNRILDKTKRASSLVENLNSRIRVYMDLKRMVPEKYFTLLKVYFNTRKYHRSRIPERVGKSPLELMSGKKYPEFLEILGY